MSNILRNNLYRGNISVTNSAFSFSMHHPLPLLAMQLLQESYDKSCWNCIGPALITRCVIQIANTTLIENIPQNDQINFTPMPRFLPVRYKKLFPDIPVKFQMWQKTFRKSSAVHFFSKETSMLVVEDNPQHNAYALLGPRYCPRSYYSDYNF
jgi:hypothetical protein